MSIHENNSNKDNEIDENNEIDEITLKRNQELDKQLDALMSATQKLNKSVNKIASKIENKPHKKKTNIIIKEETDSLNLNNSNTSTSSEDNKDNLINNKYELKNLISKGAFGKVYELKDITTNEKLVVKIENNNKDQITLSHEAKILQHLKNCKNISKVLWYGSDSNKNYLVMNNLGKPLNYNLKKYKTFTLKQCNLILINSLNILEDIHHNGIIHRDIKPENLLIHKNKLVLIDFGLSKTYLKNKEHYPYNNKKSFVGTSRYASINVHNNILYSRRDDLESLFYVILYLYLGKLPWQGLNISNKTEQKKTICKIKEKIKLLDIWNNIPNEYQMLYDNIKNLSFSEKPNYKFLRSLIQINFKENNIINDNKYDWIKKPK